MFEKEAETKLSEEDYKLAEETIKPIYRNAIKNDYSFAKYGVECYLTGYNKANEWHYPSKGEYPDDKTEKFIYFKYTDCEYPCKTFGFYNGKFWDTKRGDVSNKELIAWKDIVLPKLSKESE